MDSCKNCAVMHRANARGTCRCRCHMPSGISSAAYQRIRGEQMREHNERLHSHGSGSSYF